MMIMSNQSDDIHDRIRAYHEAELDIPARTKITQKALDSLQIGERLSEGDGFYAERLRHKIAFRLQKRIRGSGKAAKSFLLGYYPDTSIKEAREKAAEYRKESDAGNNPRKTLEEAREAEQAEEVLDLITLEDVFNWWHVDMQSTKSQPIKDSTVKYYRYLVNGVSPKWWKRSVRSITEEVVKDHYTSYCKMKDYERQAQQWINTLRPLWKEVILGYKKDGQKLITENPFLAIRVPTQSKKREGHLRAKELHGIFEDYLSETGYRLQGKNYPFAFDLSIEAQHNVLTLLAYTGLRVSEILAIKEKDYIKTGELLRGEPLEKPLLRVFIKKTGKEEPQLKYIPVTPLIEKVLERQALVRELFFDSKPEHIKRGKEIRNYKKEWETDYMFFSHDKKGSVLDRKLKTCTEMWRQWVGQPEVWKIAKEENRSIDKNDKFSAHWLRHSFTTVAKDLGYNPDVDVAKAVGKAVRGQTSQSGYSHDDAVDDAEDSRAMYERVQAYITTEAFQKRDIRRYFKAHKTEDIDLTDPT